MIRLLALDECADVIVGNNLMRGVSGGQRKRVTTGEMVVGCALKILAAGACHVQVPAAAVCCACRASRRD